MTFQDIAATNETPRWSSDENAEFESDLVKLLPFLRGFAKSLAGTGALADDLAQMALTKAWQSRRSFLLGSNLKAWLCTILRNEFYSHRRSAWRQAPWDPMLGDNMPAPFDEQEWVVELRNTAYAMDALPASQREALILVGVGGLSYSEAAVFSKTPVGTMKSRVGRARRALKESLASKRPLLKSRSDNGNTIHKMVAQLSQLTRTAVPHRPVTMAIA